MVCIYFKIILFVNLAKGLSAIAKVREIDVEKDVEKLVKYCCINYNTTDGPIKLKPDRF